MTAQSQPLGQPDMLISAQNATADPPQSHKAIPQDSPSDLQEGLTSFMGGLSGLLFVISLIFVLQAPLVSGGILLTLISGWGGAAIFNARRSSSSK